ncbi:MAG: hypothetical protein MJE77_04430 [Proteobacteria bacterium]|nr:hypothetical protein [Pseudomonadota bacterium]
MMSRSIAITLGCLFVLLVLSAGCGGPCPNFKQGVNAWTSGPAYSGAVKRLTQDQTIEDVNRRAELVSLAGLQCLLDEDKKASTAEAPTAACKCAKPSDSATADSDCKAWADSVQ